MYIIYVNHDSVIKQICQLRDKAFLINETLPTPLWKIHSPTSTIKQSVSTRSCDVLSFVSKDICFKMSRDIFSPLPPPLNLKLAAVQSSLVSSTGSSGGYRGGARGGPPHLIFRPNWSLKGRNSFFLRLAPLVSGSGWLLPSHLIWMSGSAGQQRERYVLLARQFWLLYLTLSNKPEWKKYPKIRPISSSFQTFSLTWSPFPPESYLKSETKIETDLRLWKT